MTKFSYLDHFACCFIIYRWVLVCIDVVIISLAITKSFSILALIVTGVTGATLVFNIAVGLADRKVRKRIPGEIDFPTPRFAVIAGDSILAVTYLVLWVLMNYYGIGYVPSPRLWASTFYASAYLLVGTLVMCNFHLVFAVVSLIRRWRITKIVEARRRAPMSLATDEQNWPS